MPTANMAVKRANAASFDWNDMGKYTATGKFLDGYPADIRTLFSPEDEGVHQLLVDMAKSATHSIVINMYGYDDAEIDTAIRDHISDPHFYFQASLDKSQAGGKSEKALLAEWQADAIGTSIAVGNSSAHAISHLKVMIVDGIYVVSGSTNWSIGGETKQDNELTIHKNAVLAAQYRSILDRNHTEMLKQMHAATVVTAVVEATKPAA